MADRITQKLRNAYFEGDMETICNIAPDNHYMSALNPVIMAMTITEDILHRGEDDWLNEAITCLMFAHAHFPGNSWGKEYVDVLVDLKAKATFHELFGLAMVDADAQSKYDVLNKFFDPDMFSHIVELPEQILYRDEASYCALLHKFAYNGIQNIISSDQKFEDFRAKNSSHMRSHLHDNLVKSLKEYLTILRTHISQSSENTSTRLPPSSSASALTPQDIEGHSNHSLGPKPCSVVLRKITPHGRKTNTVTFKNPEFSDSETEPRIVYSKSSEEFELPKTLLDKKVLHDEHEVSSSDSEFLDRGQRSSLTTRQGKSKYNFRPAGKIQPVYSRERKRPNIRPQHKTHGLLYVESPLLSQEGDKQYFSLESETDSQPDVIHMLDNDRCKELSSSVIDSKEKTDIDVHQRSMVSQVRYPTARKSTINKMPTKRVKMGTQTDLSSTKKIQTPELIPPELRSSKKSKHAQKGVSYMSVNTGTKLTHDMFEKDKQFGENKVSDISLSGVGETDDGVLRGILGPETTVMVIRQADHGDASDIDVEELSDSCLDPKNPLTAQQETNSLSSLLDQLPKIYGFKASKQDGTSSIPTARKTTRRRQQTNTALKSTRNKARTKKQSKLPSSESSHLGPSETLANVSVDQRVDLGSQNPSPQIILEEVITSPTVSCSQGADISQAVPKVLSTIETAPKEPSSSDSQKLVYHLKATELIGYKDGVNWRESTPPDPPCASDDSAPWMKGCKYAVQTVASRLNDRDYISPPVIAVGSSDQISEDKIVAYKIEKELRGKDSPSKVDLKRSCSTERTLRYSLLKSRQITSENTVSGGGSKAKTSVSKLHISKIDRLVRKVKRRPDSDGDVSQPRKLRKTDTNIVSCTNVHDDKPSHPKTVKRTAKHTRSVASSTKHTIGIPPTANKKQLSVSESQSSKEIPQSIAGPSGAKPHSVVPGTKTTVDLELLKGYQSNANSNNNNNKESVSMVMQCGSLSHSKSPTPHVVSSSGTVTPSFKQSSSFAFVPPSPEIPLLPSVEDSTSCFSQSQSQYYYGPMQLFVQESREMVSESETEDSPNQTHGLWSMKKVYFN